MAMAEDLLSTDIEPKSHVIDAVPTAHDNGNDLTISLRFSRHTAEGVKNDYRDVIHFTRFGDVKVLIRDLRGLANRLVHNCVAEIGDSLHTQSD